MSELSVPPTEPRRYRILHLIGKGGFGRVYRARMEGPEGFVKDVALKLLHVEAATTPDVLERFRDEARILGLVRDRAIVSVDPPTQIAGRWAVVMEFVDGASASRLGRLGDVPPGVTMEVGVEVARALHKIYKHPGLDGQPLRLIHRDIKPANLQITPSGEVKLLDFGIARAEFTARESHTTFAIGGTKGYIAPERLRGNEGPEGDIYSLGALLTRLVTGELPDEDEEGWRSDDPAPSLVGDPREILLEYARKMRAPRPRDRPSAKEVQRDLAAMRKACEGELLRDWAERIVPAASRLADDDLVGTVVSETLSPQVLRPQTEETENSGLTRSDIREGVSAYLLGMILVLFGVLTGGAVLLWQFAGPEPRPSDPPVSSMPPPLPVLQAEPDPVEPEPTPAPIAPPVAPPKSPVPGPVPVATLPVTITSIPMGATVRIDGRRVGTTPLLQTPLKAGTHRVQLSSGEASTERTIRVGKRLADRFVWRVEGDQWEEGL